MATESQTQTRSESTHYRRRLRSRIIVSFLLLGFGLTAMFAFATVLLRNRLEGQLLDSTLLDEATSHLDLWNEQLVNAAIKQIAMTRILVAHRPETIAMAERVIVVDHGRIVRDLEQPANASGRRRSTGSEEPSEEPTTASIEGCAEAIH